TYMFIASLRVSAAVALVFLLLALTYWALWLGAGVISTDAAGHGWTGIGGYLGLATAAVAFYTSFAGVTNATFGKVVVPVMPLNRPLMKNV
ncbi:MAG: hypothetical protein DLM70_00015, partial [Chloroflexi bacterium]